MRLVTEFGDGGEHPQESAETTMTHDELETLALSHLDWLGCALDKAEGTVAPCSKCGHRHALEVESAVGPGGEVVGRIFLATATLEVRAVRER